MTNVDVLAKIDATLAALERADPAAPVPMTAGELAALVRHVRTAAGVWADAAESERRAAEMYRKAIRVFKAAKGWEPEELT